LAAAPGEAAAITGRRQLETRRFCGGFARMCGWLGLSARGVWEFWASGLIRAMGL
jgi:hypothetical protein